MCQNNQPEKRVQNGDDDEDIGAKDERLEDVYNVNPNGNQANEGNEEEFVILTHQLYHFFMENLVERIVEIKQDLVDGIL